MRVYHLTKAKHALDSIAKKRLKISTINDLNDPFELLAMSSQDQNIRLSLLETKRQLSESSGVLCFSSDWKNPVLWSHYGDRHQGVALGFDVPGNILSKVVYSSKRIEFELERVNGALPIAQNYMREMLTTKYSHWRYEKEFRAFVSLDEKCPQTGLHFVDFSDQLILREVVIGSSSSVARAEVQAELAENASTVEIINARLAFRSFSVVRQRNSKFWT